MQLRHFIIISILLIWAPSCKEKRSEKNTNRNEKTIVNDLEVDHFNIWVKDPAKAKKRLIEIGFTAVPDSLSQIHHGQGTAGRYINFLNAYLELIFVYNQKEFEENNNTNKNLDFKERANFNYNDASPFSVALKVKSYDTGKIPFETVPYHQAWMEDDASIYSAKNSKTNLKEPSLFVVYPQIEAANFTSLAELQSTPSEDDSWKELFKHPNGAQKVTFISITSKGLNLNTETMQTANSIENLNIKSGSEHLMELSFDNNIQGKSFDLRPELPLIINL